ncbi:hypothetical protein CAOG_08129 [Capsaspora owczarzaki ATCC 30864]|uniref:hypothetical protein n=1 Tax=Capsaspora owczarzaki (strain ATCC 30864) TaxID=595528 RepID=UPI00035218E9|nr:hypothetical protein CAOG_08129 [Capsaspora owczarzaki ATCC 30864]|eukprot:XP_004342730.2 hypothetical protein CAOG_08129 [Capsaspora owczarzaki ATCC 30864]
MQALLASDSPVTLFLNDGLLSVATAIPFVIPAGTSIQSAASMCHQALFGTPSSAAKLFTDLGVELMPVSMSRTPLVIPANQALVVTGGEPFFPLTMHSQIYQDATGASVAAGHTLAGDSQATQDRLSGIYNESRRVQEQQYRLLQSLFGQLEQAQTEQQQKQLDPLELASASQDFLDTAAPLVTHDFANVLDSAVRALYRNDGEIGPDKLASHVSYAMHDLQLMGQPTSTLTFPSAAAAAADVAAAAAAAAAAVDAAAAATTTSSATSSSSSTAAKPHTGAVATQQVSNSIEAIFNNMALPRLNVPVATREQLSVANWTSQPAPETMDMCTINRKLQVERYRDRLNLGVADSVYRVNPPVRPGALDELSKAESPAASETESTGSAAHSTSTAAAASMAAPPAAADSAHHEEFSMDMSSDEESGAFSMGSGAGAARGKKVKERGMSHKQAEQRARDRLRTSMQELVLSLPAPENVKNASRATVLKKAAEFLAFTRRRNDTLKAENDRAKREIMELEAEQRRLQQQIQAANLMTVEITDKNHRYVFVDHMWEIVTGYQRTEALGKLVRDVAGCPTCALMIERGLEIMHSIEKGIEWSGLMMSRRKDGRIFASLAHIVPVMDETGQVIQNVCTRRHFHLLDPMQASSVCTFEKSLEAEVQSAIPLNVVSPEIVAADVSQAFLSAPIS